MVAFFDLLQSVGIVISACSSVSTDHPSSFLDLRCYWNISAVDNFGPAVEGIGVQRDIIAAAEANFT